MGAAREEFLRRSMVAGVASGVVMSLTALTVGVAPAVAEPDVVETTTVQAPAPSRGSESGGGQGRSGQDRGGRDEAPKAPKVTSAAPEATQEAPAAPPQTQAPVVTVVPDPEPAPVPAQTQAPAPEPVAPRPKPAPEPEPQAEAPASTTERPSTRVTTSPSAPAAEPAAPVEDESKAVERETSTPDTTTPDTTTPDTTTAPTTTALTTTTGAPAADAPREEVPKPSASEETSTEERVSEKADPAGTPEADTPEADRPETDTAEPAATDDASESAEATEVEPVARVIETLKPQVLEAPVEDVVLAGNTKPIEAKPEPAKVEELAQLSSLIGISKDEDRLREERRDLREDQRQLREDQRRLREDQRELRAEQRDLDRRVRQWSSDWVQYDEFYRPMIVNPYRDPVRIVYEYENRPRTVVIPPLQRMVMYVADLAAYSFTAVVLNAVNTAVSVAVGSFFGGGFIPTIGALAPPPPPPLWRYDNVPVQVRYSDAVYEPFRVQRIVDVGDDARYGERRVLLDGVTPVWGVWKQNAGGERQFEVHRTQQYPGLDTPREAPLPGDYRLRLASEEAPAGADRSQTYLITAAIACAVLSLGAVGAAGLLGRRRQI
ncbi:hypothetical protein [Mycolicibacterium diernhoferi]|uniref:Uncharacterized protein n=2 Tax=Mycolicibacterium diernhoferi TaxID=1801 RepID=A0A1Q4HLU4_9MYCO|nr:hypothetical protein [Mycolicibacterium diernhoferi]OJZ68486.1 hypothetical protein BRW64_02625 [Mycolicibacterium diernhoferi]PEG54490.1 hypothetical protein CRI78_11465 [Mycolicibacterium diernhoferi]QYL21014.1 hypothetical protein K0O62_18410 [Mycolicibacterium diernhoferi]